MGTDFYNRHMFYGADSKTIRAASMLRKNMTLAELILWNKLKDRKLFKMKFRRQHPLYIFIVDFYCHQYKLVIEIDGEVHNDTEAIEYDLNRTTELTRLGIKEIRFTNEQVICNVNSVISQIQLFIEDLAPL